MNIDINNTIGLYRVHAASPVSLVHWTGNKIGNIILSMGAIFSIVECIKNSENNYKVMVVSGKKVFSNIIVGRNFWDKIEKIK